MKLTLLAVLLMATAIHAAETKLWYDKPAATWETEALPIGNGRLGAMVFGGVERERIQFNEDSLWIGDENDTGAYQAFGDVLVTFADGERTVTNPSNHASPGGQTPDHASRRFALTQRHPHNGLLPQSGCGKRRRRHAPACMGTGGHLWCPNRHASCWCEVRHGATGQPAR